MTRMTRFALVGWLCAAGATTGSVLAAQAAPPPGQVPPTFVPQLNQPGKDVQWVPTPPALVEAMLNLAGITPDDFLVDLGSGDGVLVIAAAQRGARARGIEYEPQLVAYSRERAKAAGVTARTSFVRGDIFKTDFSTATVVTSFLLPSMNLRLRPTFLAMKPGTRIVANTFGIADWEPDDTVAVEPCERWCNAMLWIVPARVGGTWITPKGPLTLTQRFQFFSGTLDKAAVEDGRLRGNDVSFRVGTVNYRGRVDGARLRVTGTVNGQEESWTAQPAPRR